MQMQWPAGRVGRLAALIVAGLGSAGTAQDYSVLRINEVIADNGSTLPRDAAPGDELGSFVDMVEIYNTGSEALTIGDTNPNESLALSDTETLPFDPAPYTFRNGVKVEPGESTIVFCDGNFTQDLCEPHAKFQLSSDGTEPVTLWGPVIGVDGNSRPVRQVIDQVWLPPLRGDVSFGRFPDGAGPAPVPQDQVLTTFRYNPPGTATFGSCAKLLGECRGKTETREATLKRFCRGASNAPGGNIEPRVSIEDYSTNAPAAGEAVDFRVKVDDEKGPTPPNIALVEFRYRINGGAEQTAPLTFDARTGEVQGVLTDIDGETIGPNPFDFWAYYDGAIPGQAAGAVVEFSILVRDADGGEDSTPGTLCAEGVGPCDRDFGGPGCELDPTDFVCSAPQFEGIRYRDCRTPFRYLVGGPVRPDVVPLVINEIVASQDGLLDDATELACSESEGDACPDTDRNCCRHREDFLELFNSSATQTVDLSGLWLSDGPFNPQVWPFPASAVLGPGEYLIVWLDRDGRQCPDPNKPVVDQPCFWECPDPTNVGAREYHTNFALNADGDEVFLFDTALNQFGVIHGARFTDLPTNHSLSLTPNGERNGCWVVDQMPTAGVANDTVCPTIDFQRGDSDGNCVVEITDAIFTLSFLFGGGRAPTCPDGADSNDDGRLDLSDAIFALGFLFLGTAVPPAPGPVTPGVDPTEDALEACAPCG